MKNENDLIPCDDELNRLKIFLAEFKRPTGWVTERQELEWRAKWMAYERTSGAFTKEI